MKTSNNQGIDEIMERISTDRIRTNLLKNPEQRLLAFLVRRVPDGISPNMLTLIGLSGSLIIFLSFILAANIDHNFLLLGIAGFLVNWLGDSLDGRVAIYRNKPRKWYGFSLDLTTDWISTILIGSGYIVYAQGYAKIIGFAFVVLYGWEIITTLIRYRVSGEYLIDPGLFGPTEVRILVSIILAMEVLVKGSIIYSTGLACMFLLFMNISDTKKLLRLADKEDIREKAEKLKAYEEKELAHSHRD